MKNSVLYYMAFSALAITGVNATAQETGTLITRPSAEIDGRGPDRARRTMERFMACLVARHSGRAKAVTDLPIDSQQYQRTIRSMYESIDDECLSGGGQLSFSENLFRGGLFQALYEREFGDSGPTDFSAVTNTGYRQLYPEELSAEARAAIALEQFGECVSRADANGVRSFLRQSPGSAGEDQAIAGLRPKFAACIPQNNTIRFSPSVLKGAVAEGLYRLSVAALSLADAR